MRACETEHILSQGVFSAFTVSPRLGNTPRYLACDSGEKFETLDNSAVDALQEQFFGAGLSVSLLAWVHIFESKFHYALAALVVVVLFSWGMVQYGVPALSKTIAQQLPDSVRKIAGEQTLQALDEVYFSESTLAIEKIESLNSVFQPVFDQYPELTLRALYRQGGKIGANAFALPDGAIIFTDEMIALAENNEELLSVLLHEIGHVKYRHGLQAAVQNSLLVFMLLFISGDVSGTAEIFLALPVILTEMSYSRKFERSADDFSLGYFSEHGLDSENFSKLMRRLDASHHCQNYSDDTGVSEDCIIEDLLVEQGWLDYFSSHPAMEERLKRFNH